MHKLWIIGLFGCMQVSAALADTSLLVFGASKHFGCDRSCDFQEFNPGVGLELSSPTVDWGRPFVRFGAYRDSFGDMAGFAAGGLRNDWPLSGDWRAGIGMMVGYQISPRDGIIALPFVYIASGSLAVEAGFVPFTRMGNRSHKARQIATLNVRWDF